MRTNLLFFIALCFITISNADYSNSKNLIKKLNKEGKCETSDRVVTSESIGQSAKGTPIQKYTFKIKPKQNDEAGRYKKVKVLLMGNIHGNEISGRQLLKKMVLSIKDLMCNSKKQSKKVIKQLEIFQHLLTEIDLTIIPSVNPDGFDQRLGYTDCCDNDELEDHCISTSRSAWEGKREMRARDKECRDFQNSKLTQKLWTAGRYAENTKTHEQNVDMNRDFPDATQIYFDDESALFDQSKIHKTLTKAGNNQHEYFQAEESRILQRLFEKESFDYTISYHDGAQVVSYGLDKALGRFGVEPKDIDLFKNLSENYASHITEGCQVEYGNQFKTGRKGVTNGAEWYSIAGTSTDYQYIKYGTIPLTIEMSCNKFSSKEEIEREGGLVDSHEEATMDFLQSIIRSKAQKRAQKNNKSTPMSHTISGSPKQQILLVGNSKILYKCEKGTCKPKRIFFEHVESKITYTAVSDKYGRFRKQLLNHGQYRVSVREVKFTQAKKGDKVEFSFGYGGNQLLNMGTFMDLEVFNRRGWKELQKKWKNR